MLSLGGHKAIALSSMFLITFGISMLPLYLRKAFKKYLKTETTHVALSCCLCFGAGVLMSLVFLHLIPETEECFESAMDKEYLKHSHYPVALIVVCSGFFVVYLIEETVHNCIDKHHHHHHSAHTHHEHVDLEMEITSNGCTSVEEAKKIAQARRQASHSSSAIRESVCSRRSVAGIAVYASTSGVDNKGFQPDNECQSPSEYGSVSKQSVDSSNVESIGKNVSLIGTAVVVIALSFHGLMEGMSLGLEQHIDDVWILFGALIAHKFFLAFSMSMELLEVGISMKPFLLTMSIFSLASPIGGTIGALVSSSKSDTAASVLAPAFLQAISAGTIIYVTFCEVLERERAKEGNGHLKLFTLALGFSVIAGLEAVGGHHHH